MIRKRYPQGKKKAFNITYDDGVMQDLRFVELMNRYGLKGTFNLNSGFLGLEGTLVRNGKTVRHDKIAADKIKEVYKGHEVAVHTLTHPNLTGLEKDEIIRQVEKDRVRLSEICGYEVVSMAYPCGGTILATLLILVLLTKELHARWLLKDYWILVILKV